MKHRISSHMPCFTFPEYPCAFGFEMLYGFFIQRPGFFHNNGVPKSGSTGTTNDQARKKPIASSLFLRNLDTTPKGDLYKQGAPEGGGGASRPRSPRKRGPEVLSLSVGLYVKGWGDLSLLSGIPYCDISLIGRKNNWME